MCAGIFRGCGRQLEGAVIMTLGYVAGMSTGIPLMFKTTLRVKGICAIKINIRSPFLLFFGGDSATVSSWTK